MNIYYVEFTRWVCACIVFPTYIIRISYVGIPTVRLPMHLMHKFSHMCYAHFFPRIRCAFLRRHSHRGISHAFNAWVFPHILCAFLPTYKMHIYYVEFTRWVCACIVFPTYIIRIFFTYTMRISYHVISTVCLPVHLMHGQTHVYYANFFLRIKCTFLTWAFPLWVCPCI